MSGSKKISRREFIESGNRCRDWRDGFGVEQGGRSCLPKEKPPAQTKSTKKILGVDVIKVGGQGVISGAHADYGWQIQAGAILAIDEINAKGGFWGAGSSSSSWTRNSSRLWP